MLQVIISVRLVKTAYFSLGILSAWGRHFNFPYREAIILIGSSLNSFDGIRMTPVIC